MLGLQRDSINAMVNLSLVVLFVALCCWWLSFGRISSYECNEQLSAAHVLVFNVCMAAAFIGVLASLYFDPTPIDARYKVMNRPDIAEVKHSFVHSGKWTMFTVWCNTIGMFYFCTAALVGALQSSGQSGPVTNCLCWLSQLFWEVTFPMAFLVNSVVTFALIPAIKKQGDYQKLWRFLRWRPQATHNGFVMAAACEAVFAAPAISLDHFPIIVLLGIGYVVFSWYLFMKTGIFHYFFLDYRFKHAPVALLVLLSLLVTFYCVGSVAADVARDSWALKLAIIGLALGTCTWSDPMAVPPQDVGLAKTK